MANFGNMVFTDPVAAQQLMQFAQLEQAAKAERDRQMLGLNQAYMQERVARENAGLERARLQSNSDLQRQQLAQQQAALAQQATDSGLNRVARASDLDKTIAGQKDIANLEATNRGRAADLARTDAAGTEAYNRLLDLVQSDDPPTDSEFKALSGGIVGDRAGYLDKLRTNRRTQMEEVASHADTMAQYWNGQLKKLKPDDLVTTVETVVASAGKSPAGKFILYDPGIGQFVPLVKKPRKDASAAVGRTIEDVINRVRGAAGRQPITPPGPPAPQAPGAVIGTTVTPRVPLSPNLIETPAQIQSPPAPIIPFPQGWWK